jgi:HSP20 family protein
MGKGKGDIFSEFDRIRERMGVAWQEVIGPPGTLRFCPPVLQPNVDIYETESELVVVLELAGIRGAEVEVAVSGRTLVLRGERKPMGGSPGRLYSQMEICQGIFQREMSLPADVDTDGATSAYEAGLLTIVLPKVKRTLSRLVKITAR